MELETALHTQQNEALSIERAAQESGYNADYLRRLLRTNPALNAGRKNKPLIVRRDLPRRSKKILVGDATDVYNVRADALSLMSR